MFASLTNICCRAYQLVLKLMINKCMNTTANSGLPLKAMQQRGYNNKLKNILALNVYAQSRGTKVINIDSFDGIHEKRIRSFAYPSTVYRPLNGPINEFIGYCTRHSYPAEPRGHFFRPAHLDHMHNT